MSSDTNPLDINSQLRPWLPEGQSYPAGLYLVATPIGNLADITLRALWVLQLADIILCEDTRVSRKLLSAYGISGKLLAYHEHNAASMTETVLAQLASGKRVALVSDAGTPLISDPGYRIVVDAHAAGHYVTSLPGASSVTVALTLAGLPTERFLFAGFLPAKAQARAQAIAELARFPATLVLLEAPHRLDDCLKALADAMGEREAAVTRELTKRHEEIRKGTVAELAAHYAEAGNPKGEIVLVIAPPAPQAAPAGEDLDALIRSGLQRESVKAVSIRLASELNMPRKQIYDRALELKTP
jgi:16S rRNA (cytidine1402-2'-O)-methyltransferase